MIFSFIMVAIGFIFGWCARSFQFGLDRDCANPDHEEMTGPDIHHMES